nr:hypothetical protein CFP56_00305 [Quercus suber]
MLQQASESPIAFGCCYGDRGDHTAACRGECSCGLEKTPRKDCCSGRSWRSDKQWSDNSLFILISICFLLISIAMIETLSLIE